jgi:hypothetical protein
LAVELEIEDGNPWYASPNIKVCELGSPCVGVPGVDVTPIEGKRYKLKAIVRNNGSSSVSDAIVNFYWANPAVGFDRSTANKVGTGTGSLEAGSVGEILCEDLWKTTYVNGGHECLLAEALHPDEDPLPPGFNVIGDRRVAQRNITVEKAADGLFSLVFEVHNPQEEACSFTIGVEQGKLEQLHAFDELFDDIITTDGRFEALGFTQARCPDRDELDTLAPQLDEVSVDPFERTGFTLAGLLEGEAAIVWITQLHGTEEVGGLGVVIHQEER